MRRAPQIVAIVAAMDAVLFGTAGTFNWPAAWILTAMYVAFLVAIVIVAPAGLLQERMRVKAPNLNRWDIVIGILYFLLTIAYLVTAGLDVRFHWSRMPLAVAIAGGVASIVAGAIVGWTVSVNPFLSRFARIQDDRGQTVVQTGPYGYVRHPMYASIIPWMLCVALMLGSWWTLIPASCIGVLLAVRTALEDGMLRAQLAGYAAYATRVRYRLIPGVW